MRNSFLVLLLVTSALFQAACSKPSGSPVPGSWQTDLYRDLISGKRIAIVANQTSMVGKRHLVDTLKRSGIDIRAIFAPVDGFRDMADAGRRQQVDDLIKRAGLRTAEHMESAIRQLKRRSM